MGASNFDEVVANTFTGTLVGASIPTPVVASADGAIAIAAGTIVITKAGVCALTLADPATADNGKIINIVSTTAYADTVSNGAGSGFNGGGASSDVGTLGAAAGNSMTVIAYGGKWYATNLTGVTLA